MTDYSYKNIEKIIIKDSFWEVVCSMKTVIINPLNALFFVDGKKIDTKTIHLKSQELKRWAISEYNKVHETPVTDIPIHIYWNDTKRCTAHYSIEFGADNDRVKVPYFVQMGKKYLFNTDDWSFTLAHELSHYFKYKDVYLDRKELKKAFGLYVFELFIYVVLTAVGSFASIQFLLIFTNNALYGLVSLLVTVTLLISLKFQKVMFYLVNIDDVLKSHYEEYLCDKSAFSICKDIKLENTFLYEEQDCHKTSHSHPSHLDRIKYIKEDVLSYKYYIDKEMFQYCKEFPTIKRQKENLRYFFIEMRKEIYCFFRKIINKFKITLPISANKN